MQEILLNLFLPPPPLSEDKVGIKKIYKVREKNLKNKKRAGMRWEEKGSRKKRVFLDERISCFQVH